MSWLFGSSSGFNTAKSMESFNNNLYGKCGGCTYINPENYSSSMFFGSSYECTQRHTKVAWNERACSRVKYVNPSIIDCYERHRKFTRYYILTAICEILGIDMNNNRLFNEIKSLIDTVREDNSTNVEAASYDIVGPELACRLLEDKDKEEIAEFLLRKYLVDVYSFIGLNKQEEAINTYKEMVKYLYTRYRNIDNYQEMIDLNNFQDSKILKLQ